MNILSLNSLQGIYKSYAIPPQADAGWIGEAGPDSSYLDEDSGGEDNEFTKRNTTFSDVEFDAYGADAQGRRLGFPAYGQIKKTEWGKPEQDSIIRTPNIVEKR